MPFLLLRVLAVIFMLLAFGLIGYKISNRIKSPVSVVKWILLILLVLLAWDIMKHGILLDIFQSRIYISYSLMAVVLGIIIGLATREIRRRVGAGAKV